MWFNSCFNKIVYLSDLYVGINIYNVHYSRYDVGKLCGSIYKPRVSLIKISQNLETNVFFGDICHPNLPGVSVGGHWVCEYSQQEKDGC